MIRYNHNFDWDNPLILDSESNYKRLIAEIWFTLNGKWMSLIIVILLDDSYLNLLKRISNKNFVINVN